MKLWEAPEVVESDEELVECAKNHGYYIYKKQAPRVYLKPCICGRSRIRTFSQRSMLETNYGEVSCFCPNCGLGVEIFANVSLNPREIDWDGLEQQARSKWNDMITGVIEKQMKEVGS